MNIRYLINDVKKNRFVTLAACLFVAAAAFLIALAAVLTVHLTGAVDGLMEQTEAPHYMQMHAGEIDAAALKRFAARNGMSEQYQALEFLNIDNAEIFLGEHSLAGNTQDNGFSVQSGTFDYLLDLNGNIVQALDGELYVPVPYVREYGLQAGDRAYVCGREFTIKGFLRDAQMNSMLASSKRFLIGGQDFEELRELGKVEYMIEFRLQDLKQLNAFAAAYQAADLPANGPAVTYPLFKMINAMSDGIMIGLLLLVGVLTVGIALLCLRFTLLAQIEEDYREIGVMKAIGIRTADIRRLYLVKYAATAGAGCLAGYALSFAIRGKLLANIRLFFGEGGNDRTASLFGLLGAALVCAVILLFVNGVLKSFRNISAYQAVTLGSEREKSERIAKLSLIRSKRLNVNLFMGLYDVLCRSRLYVTILAVFVFSAFIMIVPGNLYHTVSSESFVTYMGVGGCDLRIDLRQNGQIPEKAAAVREVMEEDSAIAESVALITKTFQTRLADRTLQSLQVELGDHSVFPVSYIRGKAPLEPQEIALSSINAKELEKKVGDELTLVTRDGERTLTVCGIYSDITNGGRTAKAVFHDGSPEAMWGVLYASLSDSAMSQDVVLRYKALFDDAKVTDIQEYVAQTYGQTLEAIGKASLASAAAALILMTFITLLFIKMLVAKDRYSIAAMKAFGYTNSDIRLQYIARIGIVTVLGILLGTLLANTAGQTLAGGIFSSLGAASFRFENDLFTACLLYPLMMAGVVMAAALCGTAGVKRIEIAEHIRD